SNGASGQPGAPGEVNVDGAPPKAEKLRRDRSQSDAEVERGPVDVKPTGCADAEPDREEVDGSEVKRVRIRRRDALGPTHGREERDAQGKERATHVDQASTAASAEEKNSPSSSSPPRDSETSRVKSGS